MNEKNLKPASVFYYFEEICKVPRPSKREEKIIAYLKAFGREHGLEYPLDPNQVSPRRRCEYLLAGQTDFLSCYTVKRKKEYFTEINIVTI